MAPTSNRLPLGEGPRVIVYHQTHHKPNDQQPVSLLPLMTNATGITHVMVAAFHLNDPPGNITLNDHPPDHSKFHILWSEVAWLQSSSVKILGMLGGFAKGSFARLDGDDLDRFESYYTPLRDVIRNHRLDGLDLDIEEDTSMGCAVRLIDRLRADFGPDFLITLAPVASGLLPGQPHLSGPEFDYKLLEQMRGHEIAWYNAQFYCGWGDASSTAWYDAIIQAGWQPERIVMGLMTNPENGPGHVEWSRQESVLRTLRSRYPSFGGVFGWEYFDSLPGGLEKPWQWVENMASVLRIPLGEMPVPAQPLANPVGQLPPPMHNYPADHIKTLLDLGFHEQQAVAALNMTEGNVEYAAGLLFAD